MNIIIIGCGKVGYTIAKFLSVEEDINVTVVDNNPDVFGESAESIDAIFVVGNGLNERTLVEAGAREADLIVSTVNADEVNILCCIMAKHLGTRHSVARVRNPDYALEFNELWKELGIDVVINPEQQTAREISRRLRYPAVSDIETFAEGRIELVSFKVSQAPDFFVGKRVAEVFSTKTGTLLAVVERDGRATIPLGDFVFEMSDTIRVLGRPSNITRFFTHIKKMPKSQKIMIVGGGKVTYYLSVFLNRHATRTSIKIIEKNRDRCKALSESLPLSSLEQHFLFINGDGTNEQLLVAEEIDNMDAFVCLTDRDEENMIISLYAMRKGVKKVITKVNHINRNMIQDLGLSFGSVITPQDITSDIIARYVEGLTGAVGSSATTIHKIFSGPDGEVNAVELQAGKSSECLDVPIKDLDLKEGVLVASIIRGPNIIIPTGESQIRHGDNVIVVAKNIEIRELDDILINRAELFDMPSICEE